MSNQDDRIPLHTRQITCRAFRLTNGDFQIEAELGDEKAQAVPFRSRQAVAPGEYMHRMALTLTIGPDDVIRDARAETRTAPWPMCGGTDPGYRALVGLRIGGGFSQKMKEQLGGVRGCTHLTELVAQAANTYMQASWPARIAAQMAIDPDPRRWPDRAAVGFVDQCHAWRRDGETIRREYPELAADGE